MGFSMYDLTRGGGNFLGAGRVAWRKAACDACHIAKRLLGDSGACFPGKFFLNGSIWCVLEHIFINFLLEKFLKYSFMIFFKHPKIIPKLNIWANGNQIDEGGLQFKNLTF